MAASRNLTKRPIFVDGSNVARSFGNDENKYSCRAIGLVVKHFTEKGHKCKAVVPQSRFVQAQNESKKQIENAEILKKLHDLRLLILAPENQKKTIDDDDFTINFAKEQGGIVVSNDQFRNHKDQWKDTVEKRLLHYSFDGDFFLPAPNPLGPEGPTLEEFLSCSWDNPDAEVVRQQQLLEKDRKDLTNSLHQILLEKRNTAALATRNTSAEQNHRNNATETKKQETVPTKSRQPRNMSQQRNRKTYQAPNSSTANFTGACMQAQDCRKASASELSNSDRATWLQQLNNLRAAAEKRDKLHGIIQKPRKLSPAYHHASKPSVQQTVPAAGGTSSGSVVSNNKIHAQQPHAHADVYQEQCAEEKVPENVPKLASENRGNVESAQSIPQETADAPHSRNRKGIFSKLSKMFSNSR